MIDLALEAAQQGLGEWAGGRAEGRRARRSRSASRAVLLKNRPAGSRGALPWQRGGLAGRTIAVIGFTANQTQAQEGGYVNQRPPFIRTTLDGVTGAFPLSVVRRPLVASLGDRA